MISSHGAAIDSIGPRFDLYFSKSGILWTDIIMEDATFLCMTTSSVTRNEACHGQEENTSIALMLFIGIPRYCFFTYEIAQLSHFV